MSKFIKLLLVIIGILLLLNSCVETLPQNSNNQTNKTTTKCVDHLWEEVEVVNAPYCDWGGFIIYECTLCGVRSSADIPSRECLYQLKETKAPTCTKEGYQKFDCTRCSNSKEEILEATGHNYDDMICTICGTGNPSFRYKAGETLVIDGVLELTINKITRWTEESPSGVIINYTYKNLGTESLCIDLNGSYRLSILNSDMEEGTWTYYDSDIKPKHIAPKVKYTAELAFILPSKTDIANVVFDWWDSSTLSSNFYYFQIDVEDNKPSTNNNYDKDGDNSSSLWTFSDAIDVNAHAKDAHSAMLSASSYVSSASSSSSPEMKVACYLDAISSVKKAKRHLNSIKKIASDLEELDLTSSDYDTFQDYVNAVYNACDDITDISITVNNYKSHESGLRKDITDILIDCFDIQSLSVELLDAFD